MEQLLNQGIFEPKATPEQTAALERLETLLALIEGWVQTVVTDALGDRIPGTVRAERDAAPAPGHRRSGRADVRDAGRPGAAAAQAARGRRAVGAADRRPSASTPATRSGSTPTCCPTPRTSTSRPASSTGSSAATPAASTRRSPSSRRSESARREAEDGDQGGTSRGRLITRPDRPVVHCECCMTRDAVAVRLRVLRSTRRCRCCCGPTGSSGGLGSATRGAGASARGLTATVWRRLTCGDAVLQAGLQRRLRRAACRPACARRSRRLADLRRRVGRTPVSRASVRRNRRRAGRPRSGSTAAGRCPTCWSTRCAARAPGSSTAASRTPRCRRAERPTWWCCPTTWSPIRGMVRDLHAAGVPHLPVRVRDGTGLVGPLVIPGVTSCLGCADLHRSDRDAAWPRAGRAAARHRRHRRPGHRAGDRRAGAQPGRPGDRGGARRRRRRRPDHRRR